MLESKMSAEIDGRSTMQTAAVNGVSLAYQVRGVGPPLMLIMGYRLNSRAWPPDFIDLLAAHFTVITFDNRGTGSSDKPVTGYALSNMALDARCLLDHLGIERTHVLGYSMGGAIAQELVCSYPERVASLVLCATFCGGRGAVYAKPGVSDVMRNLGGLTPEQASRRIWLITYAPDYLATHQAAAERQMQRELAAPTPLHAADLQFQALADFDSSSRLSLVAAPTLILTGDHDELVPHRNSEIMASLIRNARLKIISGGGHRVLWEQTQRCGHMIVGFLAEALEPADA
jgi:3-oxoadipate enol-lactonase